MENRNQFNILIVDDNPSIHEDFHKILTTENYKEIGKIKEILFDKKEDSPEITTFTLDSAFRGEEAIALVRESVQKKTPYALAFIDINMPGWDGFETISYLWQLDPNIQMIICIATTGYSGERISQNLQKMDSLLFLRKPFDMLEVRQLAYALTNKWELLRRMKLQVAMLQQNSEFIEHSNFAMILLEQTKIIFINNAFLEMLSEKKSQIYGKSILDYVPTHSRNKWKNILLQPHKNSISVSWINEELRRSDEVIIPVDVLLSSGHYQEKSYYQIICRKITS